MKIKIKDYEFELRYSMRMFINYEAIMKKSLEPDDLKNYTNFIALFFSCIISSAQYHKIQLNISYEDFINWVDDNGGEVKLLEFGKWYMEAAQANAILIQSITTSEEGSNKEEKKS